MSFGISVHLDVDLARVRGNDPPAFLPYVAFSCYGNGPKIRASSGIWFKSMLGERFHAQIRALSGPMGHLRTTEAGSWPEVEREGQLANPGRMSFNLDEAAFTRVGVAINF
jgi:hypothetical protein